MADAGSIYAVINQTYNPTFIRQYFFLHKRVVSARSDMSDASVRVNLLNGKYYTECGFVPIIIITIS